MSASMRAVHAAMNVPLLLFPLLIGLCLSNPAASREFRSVDIYPGDYPTVQAVLHMDRLLRQSSGERYGITMLGRDDHQTEGDNVALLREGRLDMARVNVTALDTNRMAGIVPSLPFLFKSPAHMRRVLDGPIGDEILASLEADGLIGLCFYDAGPRSFYSVNRPIKTAADLKGVKVRVQQNAFWIALARALGTEPVTLRLDKVSAALQSGAIEAAENNWPTYVALRHYNVARYFNQTEHSMAPAVLLFSKVVWDGLPDGDRLLIRNAAKQSRARLRTLWDDYNVTARKTVEAAGGEIVSDVDRKSFADALLPLYPVLIVDPKSRDMVRRIQGED
jgi:TRAP-type C4-dicarboxylate transport system substrate-binding protein